MHPRSTLILGVAGAMSLLAAVVQAHDGPRVWVAQAEGTLVTQKSDDDYDPAVYSQERIFTSELSPYFGTFTTQFPGFEAPRDGSGGVHNGSDIGFKIAGPLLTLDADETRLVPTRDRFGSTAPQLAITLPDAPPSQSAQYTRFTSTGVVDGFVFTSTIEEHSHLAFTFLGNGTAVNAPGPAGVYVLPMVLTSPSWNRSDWFFLAFGKDSDGEAMSQTTFRLEAMVNAVPGDTNFDGAVDFQDLVKLAQNYDAPAGGWWGTGDFDFDGAVGFQDLVSLAQNYGRPGSFEADWASARAIAAMAPEPVAGMAMAAVGSLLMGLRRSRQ